MVKVAASYGLILGLSLTVLSLVEHVLNISLIFITILIFVGGIVYSTISYREIYLERVISYGKSLLFGIVLSMFIFLILGMYGYTFASFIDPVGYKERLNEAILIMQNSGFQSTNISDPMSDPVTAVLSYSFLGLLVGLLVSSVTSIFTKKI
ncbi:MAG: DUF4199 domain-containing protein [Prevotellaceae bacterium]|jgi:hypothetical protein|nr:DUF4199 domain-containing protein [Prevotellaceae bacterium]